MRLPKVEHGHALRQRLLLGLIRVATRLRVPDVVRVLQYRPALFGAPFSAWTHEVMRGRSDWSAGERELMAAFVSSTNRCRF